MFSSSVQNTLEYYRNVILLIILKGNYFPSNIWVLIYVNNLSLGDRYLHQYLSSKYQLYSQIF